MPKYLRSLLLAVLAVLGASLVWYLGQAPQTPPSSSSPAVPQQDACAESVFESIPYIVCMVDPAEFDIQLSRLKTDATPYRDLSSFAQTAKAKGTPLVFAMNAGMYHEDLSPVGLYVEEGVEQTPLQIGTGKGNFFLKPNGVFYVTGAGKPGVLTTEEYASAKPDARLATQSGPMLVINGALHPQFEENGASRFIRNGAGVRGDGTAVFAISKSEVSFGSFARLFKDRLECPNALYFDGVVSAFSNGESTLVGGGYPAGPIISVSAKKALVSQ